MQVFRSCDCYSQWLPRPLSTLFISEHLSPTCAGNKAASDHLWHCKLQLHCIWKKKKEFHLKSCVGWLQVMLALTTAGAASATAIVYLAHNGDSSANWIAICQQFTDFCQSVSGAVVASFIAVVIFMLLVMMSALALRKHWSEDEANRSYWMFSSWFLSYFNSVVWSLKEKNYV